jgi:hypothetical protein
MYKVQILVNVVLHDNDKLFFSEIPLCAPPNPGSGFFLWNASLYKDVNQNLLFFG